MAPGEMLPALWLLLSLFLLLSMLPGSLSFQIRNHPYTIPWWLLPAAWAAVSLPAALSLRREGRRPGDFLAGGSSWMPLVPVAALLFLMSTNFRKAEWYFFLDEHAAVRLLLLVPLFVVGMELVERRRLGRLVYPLLLLAAQAYLAFNLWRSLGGAPPYRDDHPSFMYRLWIFPQVFPRAFFWNPLWNGGVLGQELVSTGAYSLGLLAYPLISLFGVERAYLPFLILLFVVAIPWLAYATVRSLRMGPLAGFTAAFLCLGTNRFFFVSLLSYGTTPALLCSFLVMVVWVLLYAAVNRGLLGFWRWLALVACLELMVFYPGTVFLLLPVGVALLLSVLRWSRRTVLFLAAAVLVLALVNEATIHRYLVRPQLAAFLAHQERNLDIYVDPSMRTLTGTLAYLHPLLLAAGLLGLLWPARKEEAAWLLPPVGLYLVMIWLGSWYKPHLQLHRMLLPLAFLLIIPAASVVQRTATGRGASAALWRGVLAATCCLTVLNVGAIFRNAGKETFWAMPSEDRWIVSWMRTHVPAEGRVFFAGPIMHEYGGGHVAWLQAATGRSMIAAHYYHFDPQVGDVNPLPKSFRGSLRKNWGYFKLMGVTHVITNNEEWKGILDRDPRMRFEREFGPHRIYSTGIEPGFLFEGAGRVEPSINRIAVNLDRPEEEVVLRFLWQPGLAADPPVTLRPVLVARDLAFIGVRPGGATRFTIRYDR